MDDKKICFIMCSNNEFLANECLLYIERLNVPEGFSVETMVVCEAHSMTEGYNEAMKSSDAKYKIYLHQDVLLLHQDMLLEMVDLFEKNPEVGMLGVIGNTKITEDGRPFVDMMNRRVGEVESDLIDGITHSFFKKVTGEYQPVIVLDGLFMATQYDIPWREDLFKGWDFYDCSQSVEFWKAGYQVVVPYMDKPWCLHDNDILNLESYDTWREVFVKEYQDFYINWSSESFFDISKINKDLVNMNLNDKKIDFIICYNNEIYLKECMDYINFLKVPEGMEIDIISVSEADSMASGYNAAMNSSDAKYKVYLHQDVFIINENFIEDVVSTFRANPEYGLLGVTGTNIQYTDANYWNKWDIGIGNLCNASSTLQLGIKPEELKEAVAVDGMLMVTQYDIPWREDIFDGFDFYDISQSIEFARAGLKVGVPRQNDVWYIHDCGLSKLSKYDYYRDIFCKEYAYLGYAYSDDETNISIKVLTEETANYYPKLRKIFEAGYAKDALKMINDLDELGRTDSNTRYLSLLCKIVMSENDFNITTGFKLCRNVDEMRTLLTKCKFLLWRLEYGKPTMGYEELSAWVLSQNNSNSQSINLIAQAFVLDKENLQISGHCYGEKKNNVVIYGADELSLTYLDLNFNHYGSIDDTINLVGIADHNFVQLNNNPSDIFYKYRHLFEYKQILSISDVYDLYEAGKVDYVFIGVCDDDYRRIYNQLCELGIPVLNEYILSSELQDNLLEQNVYDDISVSVLSDMYAYSQSGLHITWMYNSSKKIVKETYVSEARAGSLQTWFCLFDYMKNVVEVDECCVLSRDWSFNYWHFTFETMSKVHMLEENGYKGMYMFYESASARELVKLYSLDEERIIWIDCNTTSNCYHIKRMCCVEAIGGEADRNAKLLAGFSSKILENLVWDMDIEKYPKRIFIKRIGIRKLKENKDLFEKYGFVTIIPEDLTVEEQIKHFHAADIIINPHGAGSTNCIYMRKGSHFIETFGCNYIQPLCYEILKERKINYHMLVERKNVLKENGPHTSDYEIEDIAFELILQNIFDC